MRGPRASTAVLCTPPPRERVQRDELPRRPKGATDVSLFSMSGPGPLDSDLAKVRLERIYTQRVRLHLNPDYRCDICDGPNCVAKDVAESWLKGRGLLHSSRVLPEEGPAVA